MARKAFYSFHYVPDSWRASIVRNIGAIDGNRPATDNDWETVKRGGDDAIKRWIADQMDGRSCTVVLVGTNTANRKWINHEIIRSWDEGMGVVGIRIHGIKNAAQETSSMGENPFDYIGYGNTGKKLSSIVRCYNPTGATSQERYDWIKKHLANAVEEAITIRKNN
jgi:hypothetical protein